MNQTKRINLDKLILGAKIGSRDSFHELWAMYQSVVIKNIDSFCSIVKGFDQYKDILRHDSYVYFWDIINSYDFDGKYNFSYYVSEELRRKTKDKIKGHNLLPEELIDDEKLRNYSGYRDIVYRARLAEVREMMKKLTPKQLQAVYLYHYCDMPQWKAAEVVGISQVGLRKRLVQAYKKIIKYIKRKREDELKQRKRKQKRKRRVRKPRSIQQTES